MNNQLELSEEDLISIGFIKKHYVAYDNNPEKTTFEIYFLNGRFYYNPNENKYKWYCVMEVGAVANFVNINITNKPTLYTLLQSFKIPFNLIL